MANTIITQNFFLRELQMEDYQTSLAGLLRNQQSLKYSAWQEAYRLPDYPYFFSKIIHEQCQIPQVRYVFLVFNKNQEIAGVCSLTILNNDILMVAPPKKEALLVFAISSQESLLAGLEIVPGVLAFGFEKLSLKRIVCLADLHNIPLQRILERLDFTREALLKRSQFRCGDWHDHYQYAILDRDWRK